MRAHGFLLLACILGLPAALAPTAADAQPTATLLPLGRSGSTGAICEAIRNYEDPLAQARGARAWRVQCRGYGTVLGRVYSLPRDQAGAWQAALAAKAKCEGPASVKLGGLDATRASCRLAPNASPYLVYQAQSGRSTVVAEGLAPLADILEVGLRVASGRAEPPGLADLQRSAAQAEIAADFGDLQGLAAAEQAAAADPTLLRNRGYVQNNEWRFADAELVFRALVSRSQTDRTPPREQAEAMLNLALNVSNSGRFDEADSYFARAQAPIAAAGDPLLSARALNYAALHRRNQAKFDEAIALARQALEARAASGAQAAAPGLTREGGRLKIAASLAYDLNVRNTARTLLDPVVASPGDELALQDAQAYQIIGSALAAQGREAEAATALGQARAVLVSKFAGGALPASQLSRIDADLAELDLQGGRADEAVRRYGLAVATLRTRHAGSAAEAALLLDLGRAQVAAGKTAEALASFDRAMTIFKVQRGGLGASVDGVQAYLDLLLAEIARRPEAAGELVARVFDVSQAAIGAGTARTIGQLAARVEAGDTATAGLARALEDTRADLAAAERRAAALQAQGAYEGEAKAAAEAALKALQQQANALETELVAEDPRYQQLVAAEASLPQLRAALRDGEAYAKFLSLAGKSYGLFITRGGAKAYPIALTRDELRDRVLRLRAPFERTDRVLPYDLTLAADLHDALFGPVREDLERVRHLIFEPDGALYALPVAALVTNRADGEMVDRRRVATAQLDYRDVSWLGSKLGSSLSVSAASFLQSRAFQPSKAAQRYLGFGDPKMPRDEPQAFASLIRGEAGGVSPADVCRATRDELLGYEDLPETSQEVSTIAASMGAPQNVVVGAAFNDGDLKRRGDLRNYRVLYFATHALLPAPEYCFPQPALITSVGAGASDGLLDALEIIDLDFDADLVVLAACNTAGEAANQTGSGEALGGLTRAMIYAGSRGLIVTHWSVDSETMTPLMTDLFGSTGGSQADNLKRAQATMQADARLSHPYYWAALTVVGDGARPLP